MFGIFKKKYNYFDYASTTPLDPRVFRVMKPYMVEHYANPSSLYKEGVEARRVINESRKKVASILQSRPEEIIFTSGGTESNNIAILGTYFYHKNVLKKEKIHFVTTSIEHSSVLEVFEHVRNMGAKVTYVSPEENGVVSPKKIEEALRPETVLVSVMYANNEIGTVQPIREIGKIIKAISAKSPTSPISFHVDACQGGLYLPLLVHDLNVDLLTLDGSKIYGPKGTGVLYKKGGAFSGLPLSPVIFGGGQENGLRSGTENVPGIVGFGEALHIAHKEKATEIVRLRLLRDKMQAELLGKVKGLKVNGDVDKRLPNNLNICLSGLDAEYAVLRMDVLGFALSSVTSCKTLSEDSSSYVIEELYGDSSCSKSSLRITLGRFTTQKQINDLIKALLTVLHR
jgi:cysteine desulfurase